MKKFLGDVARLWGYHWPTIVWKVNNGPWIKCARKSDRGSSAPKKCQQIFSWKGGWWLDYGAICWPTIVLGVNEGTPLISLAAPSHWEKNLPTGWRRENWKKRKKVSTVDLANRNMDTQCQLAQKRAEKCAKRLIFRFQEFVTLFNTNIVHTNNSHLSWSWGSWFKCPFFATLATSIITRRNNNNNSKTKQQ